MKNSVNIFTKFNLKPGNTKRLKKYLFKLGSPEKKLKVIHVVGTNGKGTISYYLSQIYFKNGYRTGLFTSPSYWEHNERIKVNNIDIPDDHLIKYLDQIHQVVGFQPINFFELFFMIGVMYFYDQKCQVCILEAGIGGVLDSTVLASDSLFTVLTSISHDHVLLLGNKISEIIDQKIRIAQPDEPVFVAASNRKYQKIIAKYPQKLIWANQEIISNNHFINEAANLAIKICSTFNLKPLNNWTEALLPGRMMLVDNHFLLDGAHNPDAIRKLLTNLKIIYPNKKITIFYSALSTKDFGQCIRLLNAFNNKEKLWITTFNHPKALQKEQLSNHQYWLDYDQLLVKIMLLRQSQQPHPDVIYLFCGSFYFIAHVHQLLKELKIKNKIN